MKDESYSEVLITKWISLLQIESNILLKKGDRVGVGGVVWQDIYIVDKIH